MLGFTHAGSLLLEQLRISLLLQTGKCFVFLTLNGQEHLHANRLNLQRLNFLLPAGHCFAFLHLFFLAGNTAEPALQKTVPGLKKRELSFKQPGPLSSPVKPKSDPHTAFSPSFSLHEGNPSLQRTFPIEQKTPLVENAPEEVVQI